MKNYGVHLSAFLKSVTEQDLFICFRQYFHSYQFDNIENGNSQKITGSLDITRRFHP